MSGHRRAATRRCYSPSAKPTLAGRRRRRRLPSVVVPAAECLASRTTTCPPAGVSIRQQARHRWLSDLAVPDEAYEGTPLPKPVQQQELPINEEGSAADEPGQAPTGTESPERVMSPYFIKLARSPVHRRDLTFLPSARCGWGGRLHGFSHLHGSGPGSSKTRGPLIQIPGGITTCPNCRPAYGPLITLDPNPGGTPTKPAAPPSALDATPSPTSI